MQLAHAPKDKRIAIAVATPRLTDPDVSFIESKPSSARRAACASAFSYVFIPARFAYKEPADYRDNDSIYLPHGRYYSNNDLEME